MQRQGYSFWLFLVIVGLLALLPTSALAQNPGDLDPTFDGDGKVLTLFGDVSAAYAVAVQADGKIVVAGYSYHDSIYDFALVRYNPDGSLDNTFDGDGKLTTRFNDINSTAQGMAIQPDGKIVVAGGRGLLHSNLSSSEDFFLARYNTDGSLDLNFDADGKVTTGFDNSSDSAADLTLEPDGKIVVAGTSIKDGNYRFALARYNPDGSPDPSFDGNGKLVTDIGAGSQEVAYELAWQPDGKIIVVGSITTFPVVTHDFLLVRYNSNGSLDLNFGNNGKVITNFYPNNTAIAEAVALQPDNKIVVAGTVNGAFAVARYNPNGTLDFTMGGDGVVETAFSDGISNAGFDMVLQPNGKILAAGISYNSLSRNDFALIRYFSNGSLDFTFDDDGQVRTDFGLNDNDGILALALQPDGKIVAAGFRVNDMALARYLAPIPDLLPVRTYLPLLLKP